MTHRVSKLKVDPFLPGNHNTVKHFLSSLSNRKKAFRKVFLIASEKKILDCLEGKGLINLINFVTFIEI